MTADGKIDRRIDFVGTLAQLQATFPSPQFPPGTWAWCTDFGFVTWNGATWSMQNSSTVAANIGNTQGTGTLINAELCNITATAAAAILLPASVPGMFATLHNISAFTVLVFPSAGGTGTEKINALAANAGYSMATNTSTMVTCAVAGQWYTVPRTAS
jgi:hypothetical protein